jgi:hypothetical protein
MGMNRYGVIAQRHWESYAPSRTAALGDPTWFFTDLGLQVQAQVDTLTTTLAGVDSSQETFLEKVARLQSARRTAEEIVMAELVWIKDPELPVDQAREEWEQTRPSDENLIAWAERIQDHPDSMPSTAELEDMARTWALSVDFLLELAASEPPREYMQANPAALSEAATIRFLRELRQA